MFDYNKTAMKKIIAAGHICIDITPVFPRETRCEEISDLLSQSIASIIEVKEESDIDSFLSGGQISFLSDTIKGLDDFELICFLVIR